MGGLQKQNLWFIGKQSWNGHWKTRILGRKTRIDCGLDFDFIRPNWIFLRKYFKKFKKLKNTKFSIFEDVSREIAANRKEKWQEVLFSISSSSMSYYLTKP